jgi:hypothetical protein
VIGVIGADMNQSVCSPASLRETAADVVMQAGLRAAGQSAPDDACPPRV